MEQGPTRSSPQPSPADPEIRSASDAVSSSPSQLRRSLQGLLAGVLADPSSAFGYAIQDVQFGEMIEVTLGKGDATFVVWLRPIGDAASFFRKTARFKIGHRGDPPDARGYTILQRLCAQIEIWERSLEDGVEAPLFETTPVLQTAASSIGDTSLDSTIEALLAQNTFTPIYAEWLHDREQQLAACLARLTITDKRNVLLVNATKGLQFYPSVVDFFAFLQRQREAIQATGVSYFDDIFQFQAGVAAKGLPVASIAEVMTWDAAAINRFDVVLMIGASDLTAHLMALPGITAKLVLLDLAFFHQLLDAHPGWYPGACGPTGADLIGNRSAQVNRAVVYSCQPQAKITSDLTGICALPLLEWRWFNYIPIGFSYCTYYRSDRPCFDVALLGSAGRDYTQIDPALFGGMRFLFLGMAQNPAIERLRQQLDITVVSGVNEDTYARLLALCRCVVLPYYSDFPNNVFMSVIDAVASGKALVTPRHESIARLEREGLPALFYEHPNRRDLFTQADNLCRSDELRRDLEARAIAFAKEKLDIYRILATILEEQIL